MGIQWIKESYIRVLAGIRYFTKQMKQNQKKHKKGGGGRFRVKPDTPTPVLLSLAPPSQNPHPPCLTAHKRETEREGAGRGTSDR